MRIVQDKIELIKNKYLENQNNLLNDLFICILKNNNIKILDKIFSQNVKHLVFFSLQEIYEKIALHLVSRHDENNNNLMAAIKYLHKHYPELNKTDLLGEASIRGHDKIVEYLIKNARYDPNRADDDKQTPLHKAITYKHVKVIDILCKNGANPKKQNGVGLNALFTNEAYNMEDNDTYNLIRKILTNHGAKLTDKISSVLEETRSITLFDFKKLLIKKYKIEQPNTIELKKQADNEKSFSNIIISYLNTIFSEDQQKMPKLAFETSRLVIKALKSGIHGEYDSNYFLKIINDFLFANILTYNDAIQIFSDLQKLGSQLPKEIFTGIAVYYLHNNEYKKAEKYSLKSIEIAENGNAYYNLYRSLILQNKTYEAEQAILKAKEYLPEDIDVIFGLISIKTSKNLHYEAIQLLKLSTAKAVELGYAKDIAAIYYHYSLSIFTSPESASLAFELLGQAIELDPENQLFLSTKNLIDLLSVTQSDSSLKNEFEELITTNPEAIELSNAEVQETENSDINHPLEAPHETAKIDDLTTIEVASYLTDSENEAFLTNENFNPSSIHKYFQERKKLNLLSFSREKPVSSWRINETDFFTSDDSDVYQLNYLGKTIYAVIKKDLFNSLEKIHQDAFINAIRKGFVLRAEGQNGIKIIDKKLIELKINDDKRLVTTNIFSNNNKEQLIIFEEKKSHAEVSKTLHQTKHTIHIIDCPSYIPNEIHEEENIYSASAEVRFAMITYDNPLLNNKELIKEMIKIYGSKGMALLLELGKDQDLANQINTRVGQVGAEIIAKLLVGEQEPLRLFTLTKEAKEMISALDLTELGLEKILHSAEKGNKISQTNLNIVGKIYSMIMNSLNSDDTLASSPSSDNLDKLIKHFFSCLYLINGSNRVNYPVPPHFGDPNDGGAGGGKGDSSIFFEGRNDSASNQINDNIVPLGINITLITNQNHHDMGE